MRGTPVERFTPPDGVYSTWICSYNGLRLEDKEATSSAYPEYFLDGTGPAGVYTPPTPSPSPEPEEEEKDKPSPSPSPESQAPGQEKKEEENTLEIQIGI